MGKDVPLAKKYDKMMPRKNITIPTRKVLFLIRSISATTAENGRTLINFHPNWFEDTYVTRERTLSISVVKYPALPPCNTLCTYSWLDRSFRNISCDA